jgi:hypothetical protein
MCLSNLNFREPSRAAPQLDRVDKGLLRVPSLRGGLAGEETGEQERDGGDVLSRFFREPEAFFEPTPPRGHAVYHRNVSGGEPLSLVTASRSPLWVGLHRASQ